MALANYTFICDQVLVGASITATSPIEGIGSFDVSLNANASGDWVLGYNAGLVKHCVDVKVLFQERSTQSSFYGLGIFVQSQGALGLTTNAYTGTLATGESASPLALQLAKGLITGQPANVTTTVTSPAHNTTAALGLRAEYNSTTGNVLVTVSYDPGPITTPVTSSYAFPGLVPLLAYNDTLSPYVTGVSFGLCGHISTGAPAQQLFDVLSVDTD
jgi:hypothetical protein